MIVVKTSSRLFGHPNVTWVEYCFIEPLEKFCYVLKILFYFFFFFMSRIFLFSLLWLNLPIKAKNCVSNYRVRNSKAILKNEDNPKPCGSTLAFTIWVVAVIRSLNRNSLKKLVYKQDHRNCNQNSARNCFSYEK